MAVALAIFHLPQMALFSVLRAALCCRRWQFSVLIHKWSMGPQGDITTGSHVMLWTLEPREGTIVLSRGQVTDRMAVLFDCSKL